MNVAEPVRKPSPTLATWLQASRPKTLMASAAPVVMGLAMASHSVPIQWTLAVLTLISAITLQIGTNYINDLFDFLKGGDRADRIGPTRVVQAGLVSVPQMKAGIGVVLGVCVLAGLFLAWRSGPYILGIGLVGVAMAFLYTVGPSPLAYNGLSDLMVLLFFGVLAVSGTVYVQTREIAAGPLIAGLGPGLISTALLTVNNIRDIGQDTRAGRKTLAVRFGVTFAKWEYLLCQAGAAAVPWVLVWRWEYPTAILLASLSGLLAIPVTLGVWRLSGGQLNRAMGQTSMLLLVHCLLYSGAWIFLS